MGDEHAKEKDAEAVEKEDPVEGELDGTGDGLARVLCFSNCYTDEFGSCM